MPFLNIDVLDNGLQVLTSDTTDLYICSAEPTTFTEASVTFALGLKTTPVVAAPSTRVPSGREVIISSFTNGTVTATGTATHWALVQTSGSRLLAAAPLLVSQAVTNGNPFSLNSFAVGIPGPA